MANVIYAKGVKDVEYGVNKLSKAMLKPSQYTMSSVKNAQLKLSKSRKRRDGPRLKSQKQEDENRCDHINSHVNPALSPSGCDFRTTAVIDKFASKLLVCIDSRLAECANLYEATALAELTHERCEWVLAYVRYPLHGARGSTTHHKQR